jgi:hypothetical protein
MNKPIKSKQHSNSVAKGEDQSAQRKAKSPLSRREARVDIAIQSVSATVAILLTVVAVVGVSDLTSKLAITLWLSGVAAVLILLGLGLYLMKTVWAQEPRPELFIEEARILPLILGKPQTVAMLLRNSGVSPARNIKLGPHNASLKPKDFTGPLSYGDPKFPVDTTTELAGGAAVNVSVVVHIEVTEERLQQFNDGGLLYFHYGQGSYEDDAGRTYRFDYCFMYSPMAPTILRICPNQYRPRKDHEDQK